MTILISIFCFLINFSILIAAGESFPAAPLLPSIPSDRFEQGENSEATLRRLLSTGVLEVQLEADVVVPLEVISDVHIKLL